jgi:hypothetical protein
MALCNKASCRSRDHPACGLQVAFALARPICSYTVLLFSFIPSPASRGLQVMSTVRWEPRDILHRRQAPCRKESPSGPNPSAPVEQTPGLREYGTKLALPQESGVAMKRYNKVGLVPPETTDAWAVDVNNAHTALIQHSFSEPYIQWTRYLLHIS